LLGIYNLRLLFHHGLTQSIESFKNAMAIYLNSLGLKKLSSLGKMTKKIIEYIEKCNTVNFIILI